MKEIRTVPMVVISESDAIVHDHWKFLLGFAAGAGGAAFLLIALLLKIGAC